ncbi:potassium channel family protein [Pseudoxanthomonas daejeonensis]|uniref:potassium channel family protein n=1 Tax=Pseudoxanthomonas daejeonensis TaxID=266062 RepID=UPI001F543CDF|nr:potassium channel family protein [Pseudoxanthomonas daejeonensis]UNK56311.1 potassium channel family protein [Pseudoxanthomonas daejeonensis]
MRRSPALQQITRHRYAILFCVLLATIAVGPLLEALDFGRVAVEALLTFSLIAAVFPIGVMEKRRTMLAIVGTALLMRGLASHLDSAAFSALGAVLWGAVAVVAAFGAIRYSLSSVRVDAEHLYAALSAYLLIGVCWGVVYVAVVRVDPLAMLHGGTPLPDGLSMGDAIYFSFVTLATLGYGDFTPATPVMRGLSVFEAIIGQLYLAIMVARLVSLRVSDQSSR